MAGLQREVLKWLQSLDLTWQIKQPKWDMSNGYLAAEIFSWYFHNDIDMTMFNNGKSLDSKQKNWDLINNCIKKNKLGIPEEIIDGTIHCRENAAHLLIEVLYELLTNRRVKRLNKGEIVDFSDQGYQDQLPMHARSTATKSVKNNLKVTELKADRSIILEQRKAQVIINSHVENRKRERSEDRVRFNRKPTLGELAPRTAPVAPKTIENTEEKNVTNTDNMQTFYADISSQKEPSIVKEVMVNQHDGMAPIQSPPITSY